MTPAEHSKRTLFREVNARIRDLAERFGTVKPSYVVLCECGSEHCLKRVEVPVAVYDEVVDGPHGRFLIAPGHERSRLDRLVSREAGYCVVELRDAPRRRGAAMLRVVPAGAAGHAD